MKISRRTCSTQYKNPNSSLFDDQVKEDRIEKWLTERHIFNDEPTAKKDQFYDYSRKMVSLVTSPESCNVLWQSSAEETLKSRHKSSMQSNFLAFQESFALGEVCQSSLLRKRVTLLAHSHSFNIELWSVASPRENFQRPQLSKNFSLPE
jgi:hypothetical protein